MVHHLEHNARVITVSACKPFRIITVALIRIICSRRPGYPLWSVSAAGKLVLISPDTAIMFISLCMRSAWLIYLVLQSAGKWNLFGGIVGNSSKQTYIYGRFESFVE